ncbi:MAG TPA: ATP-binding protein [Saprospiraceae bacterium]|nr:ATP-binding protein [Saprospiraceae bacterium]HMP15280.1 ATP-binding protein [Saprospiraceae bacterium]
MVLDVDTIIPLGLIINELISNTLKYAFPNGRAGKMYIALKQETKALRLRIADNGKGLPPNFDMHNLKSLGFRLVKAFTQKLEGELNIQSEQGVIIDIYIPNYKAI